MQLVLRQIRTNLLCRYVLWFSFKQKNLCDRLMDVHRGKKTHVWGRRIAQCFTSKLTELSPQNFACTFVNMCSISVEKLAILTRWFSSNSDVRGQCDSSP